MCPPYPFLLLFFLKAEIESGKFCGLALDEDNQGDLTESRINNWTQQVLVEMGVKVKA